MSQELMTRDEAIELAKKHIDACHPGQHPDFTPVEWVVSAILEAANPARERCPAEPNQEQLPF